MMMTMMLLLLLLMMMMMLMLRITSMMMTFAQDSGQAMDSIMFSNRGGKVASPTGFYWSGWATDAGYAVACRGVACDATS